jgi:hypothetical protein
MTQSTRSEMGFIKIYKKKNEKERASPIFNDFQIILNAFIINILVFFKRRHGNTVCVGC